MQEQAERQNRNFEDIVAERYGVSIHIKEIMCYFKSYMENCVLFKILFEIKYV